MNNYRTQLPQGKTRKRYLGFIPIMAVSRLGRGPIDSLMPVSGVVAEVDPDNRELASGDTQVPKWWTPEIQAKASGHVGQEVRTLLREPTGERTSNHKPG